MADSILRLKVESQEYDQKIKRAAEGIQQYAQKCREAGGTLEHLDEGVEDFVKAVGQMETVSKSAKGSINEMTKAFTDLSVEYNKLTEDEKNSPFGKALASSLDQLKNRIQSGNAELKNIGSSLNNTGGFLDSLKDKFTINIDALKLFNTGVTAAKMALDVAKDAFFASEATVDEWGRTMQSAQGLYEGFLNAINTGDISGYLNRMDEIVRAARAAYDEMDKLNTMKTIQAPGISRQQTENERIRMMIQTGRYIAPVDGRSNSVWNGQTMKNGQLLTPDQIKLLERQLQGGLQKMTDLVGNEVKQSGKAIDAYYDSLAKQNGMSLQEFKKGTSTWEEFSAKIRGYEEYKKWDREARAEFARQGGQGVVNFDKNNPYLEYKKWGTFRVDKMGENSFNDLVNRIKERDQLSSQIYSTMAQSYRTINRADGTTIRSIMGSGGSGSSGGSGATTTISPSEQAAKDIEKAQKDYAETISNAQQKLVENIMKSDDYDKQVLGGQQKLADAYLKAYNATGDEQYLSAFRETATHVNEMQGVVDANAAAQKAAEQAAKELAAAQKKLADEEKRQAELIASWQMPSDKGIGNFISTQKTDLSIQTYGSDTYNKLAANIADATAYKNLMETAIQNGLNDVVVDSSSLWQQIISGDDIPNSTWKELVDKINEKLKEQGIQITLDAKTGDVKEGKRQTGAQQIEKFNQDYSKIVGGVSSIVSGVQSMGVDIPKEIQSVFGVLQGISAIMTGVTALLTAIEISTSITAGATAVKAVPIIGTFLAGGGIIKAAGGTLVGNSYSGDNLRGIDQNGQLYGLNAGEVVLNKAQTQSLASQLSGSGLQNMHLTGSLQGEDILVSINRVGRRKGLGEVCFFKE